MRLVAWILGFFIFSFGAGQAQELSTPAELEELGFWVFYCDDPESFSSLKYSAACVFPEYRPTEFDKAIAYYPKSTNNDAIILHLKKEGDFERFNSLRLSTSLLARIVQVSIFLKPNSGLIKLRSDLRNLVQLDLQSSLGDKPDDTTLVLSEYIPTLTHLSITGARSAIGLEKQISLQKLLLWYTSINDVDKLELFADLRYLSHAGSRIWKLDFVPDLGALESLTYLEASVSLLSSTELKSDTLETLIINADSIESFGQVQLPNLRVLSLSSKSPFTGLPSFEAMPRLERLDLDGVERLPSEIELRYLEELYVNTDSLEISHDVVWQLTKLPSLKKLQLNEWVAKGISGSGTAFLSEFNSRRDSLGHEPIILSLIDGN